MFRLWSAVVFINRSAGNGNGKRIFEAMLQRRLEKSGAPIHIVEEEGGGDGVAVSNTSRAATPSRWVSLFSSVSVQCLILCGGDGTLRHVANTLRQQQQEQQQQHCLGDRRGWPSSDEKHVRPSCLPPCSSAHTQSGVMDDEGDNNNNTSHVDPFFPSSSSDRYGDSSAESEKSRRQDEGDHFQTTESVTDLWWRKPIVLMPTGARNSVAFHLGVTSAERALSSFAVGRTEKVWLWECSSTLKGPDIHDPHDHRSHHHDHEDQAPSDYSLNDGSLNGEVGSPVVTEPSECLEEEPLFHSSLSLSCINTATQSRRRRRSRDDVPPVHLPTCSASANEKGAGAGGVDGCPPAEVGTDPFSRSSSSCFVSYMLVGWLAREERVWRSWRREWNEFVALPRLSARSRRDEAACEGSIASVDANVDAAAGRLPTTSPSSLSSFSSVGHRLLRWCSHLYALQWWKPSRRLIHADLRLRLASSCASGGRVGPHHPHQQNTIRTSPTSHHHHQRNTEWIRIAGPIQLLVVAAFPSQGETCWLTPTAEPRSQQLSVTIADGTASSLRLWHLARREARAGHVLEEDGVRTFHHVEEVELDFHSRSSSDEAAIPLLIDGDVVQCASTETIHIRKTSHFLNVCSC